jgi:hypothetical protein
LVLVLFFLACTFDCGRRYTALFQNVLSIPPSPCQVTQSWCSLIF